MKTKKISTPEERMDELGYKLPSQPPAPIGNFINTKRVGNLIYISGQGPVTFC